MEKIIQKKLGLYIVLFSLIIVGLLSFKWVYHSSKVTTLVLASGAKDGQYYAFAQALSKIVEKNNSKIKIQVIETEGSKKNKELIQQKKVQLAMLQSDTSIEPSVKVVSFLFPEMFHLIVREDSNINKVSELKGKRIALMPKGSGSYALFWPLSKHYGLKEQDFKTVLLSPEEAYKALDLGEVDAVFRVSALGNSALTQLLQKPEIKLVSIDQAAALQLTLPVLEESIIPKGAYNGFIPIPADDLPVVAVRAILVTHKNINFDLIYEITRILYESRNELVKENASAAMIRQPESIQSLGFSFHDGALAYYNQDQPNFFVTYAEPLGLLTSLSVLGISSLWQLRLWLNNKQKNRADQYNIELIKIIEQIHQTNDLHKLELIHRQLLKIFEQVVIDLDKDRISPESFQSFAFPWEVAITTVRHRETVILNSRLSNS
ncbi:C4-dicarboxylate ABC transporter substrate-binding protein [Aphanothece hegewaldii CCALA 016]|uniref:C4-dicarboxylate ABC transporter substrate-binding protein n=1 Tax=Aphanothece hegewaldii CCALA 016 TaxID=2107694 RepID=A0A2T1M1Y4_9CHRO|nr:TAXI family TRAP transporter solute-binding subunit [Aphanothece hegewaldii]PSF38722.1 C4-dicarboxylate ABC transporter substrate-binding protein [Aphanothece hegewaldii CCALA 016]